jgi:hypothetical protein
MMGGFAGASIQKAQSLIDLGSSRYEYFTLTTFHALNKESSLNKLGTYPGFTLQWPNKYLR